MTKPIPVETITEDAAKWQIVHPDRSVSAFACRYPGQYGEAAEALRVVRKQGERPGKCEDQGCPAHYAEEKGDELWGADPDCDHDIQAQPRGGVKCTKCAGWFCY